MPNPNELQREDEHGPVKAGVVFERLTPRMGHARVDRRTAKPVEQSVGETLAAVAAMSGEVESGLRAQLKAMASELATKAARIAELEGELSTLSTLACVPKDCGYATEGGTADRIRSLVGIAGTVRYWRDKHSEELRVALADRMLAHVNRRCHALTLRLRRVRQAAVDYKRCRDFDIAAKNNKQGQRIAELEAELAEKDRYQAKLKNQMAAAAEALEAKDATILWQAERIADAHDVIAKNAERRPPLFLHGNFTLASGRQSTFKIDCEALQDADWQALAAWAAERLPPFGSVEGVPRGGLPFAAALKPYVTSGPLLIADDVLSTGGSMERQRAGREAVGVVVFARGAVPPWVVSLLPEDRQATYEPPDAEHLEQMAGEWT